MEGFYYFLWGGYVLSACLITFGIWRLVWRLKIQLQRDLLLGLVMATLFTPWLVVPDQDDLAPALFIAVLDGISQGTPGIWRGVIAILSTYGIIIVLLFILRVIGVRGRQDGKGNGGMVKGLRGTVDKAPANSGSEKRRTTLELSMPPRQSREARLDGGQITRPLDQDAAGTVKL